MQIKILYFARLREAFGIAGESLEIEPGTNVEDVLALLEVRGEVWLSELRSGRVVRFAVNQEMASRETVLQAGDELALFPPVTGG